jgi:4-hydroxyphenylacetate 3-monooxygenase
VADEIMFGTWQPLPPGHEKLAVTFALPVKTRGLKLISRRPYAALASSMLDDPLSSRFDETDTIAYLDNVFVPWERVFTYGRVDRAGAIINATPAHALGNAQAHIRLLSKMRLILGLIKRVQEHNSMLAHPAVQDIVARLAVDVSILEGLIEAENAKFETWDGGYIAQSRHMLYATMAWSQGMFPNFITIVRELLASHALQQPADVSVYDNPDTADIYSRFMQVPAPEAIESYKLMRMIWDLVGTEFASRHLQYEMFYNGPQHGNRARLWKFFPWSTVDDHTQAALDSIGGYQELVVNRVKA